MSSKRTAIQEDTSFRVMHILQDNPDITQRELATRLGVSVGSLNYCLRRLIEKGWVKVQNFSESENKTGYAYILTPQGLSSKIHLASAFLKRKLEEYEALKAEIAALSDTVDDEADAFFQHTFSGR